MEKQEFFDILHELIVVETEEGLIVSSKEADGKIALSLNDGSKFVVTIEKL
ncbi:MAG: hypothetical protein RR458_03620 [Clostridia bacterium]